MKSKLLIYANAVPVSATRHRDHCVDSGSYAFSREVSAVPLLAAEFAAAAREYPIVFVEVGDSLIPAAVLGLRHGENLYLDAQDGWQATYIPAFIRSYPFVFASGNDGQTLTLCIDESFAGLNREGKGQRLFTDDGKRTPYLDQVVQRLQSFQLEFARTRAFCRKLRTREVLEPMQARIRLTDGKQLSLAGFLAVDRRKLKALSAETLGEMAKSGELELIYLHLQSIRNFAGVRDRLAVSDDDKPDAPAMPTAAPTDAGQAAAA